jgi:hypothetical protein
MTNASFTTRYLPSMANPWVAFLDPRYKVEAYYSLLITRYLLLITH